MKATLSHEALQGKSAKKSDVTGCKSEEKGIIDPNTVANFIIFSQEEFLLLMTKDLARSRVSFAQFYLLSFMDKIGGQSAEISMTSIAHKMGHSTAAATGLVDRLESSGYVARAYGSSEDRRKVVVNITDKGHDLVLSLRARLVEIVTAQFGDVREFLT